MKMYLASRFGNGVMLRLIRDRLESMGHKVTSRWIDVDEEKPKLWKPWSKKCIADMDKCEVLVLCTIGCRKIRGGMRFEEGYCYGQGKPVLVVGPKIIVFDELKDIKFFGTWEKFYTYLESKPKLKLRKKKRPVVKCHHHPMELRSDLEIRAEMKRQDDVAKGKMYGGG